MLRTSKVPSRMRNHRSMDPEQEKTNAESDIVSALQESKGANPKKTS
jgi:hypothetical protein